MRPVLRVVNHLVAAVGIAVWAWLMVGQLNEPTGTLADAIEPRLKPPAWSPGSVSSGGEDLLIVSSFTPNDFVSGVQLGVMAALLSSPFLAVAAFGLAAWTGYTRPREWPTGVGRVFKVCFVVQAGGVMWFVLLLLAADADGVLPTWAGLLMLGYAVALVLAMRAWLSTLAAVSATNPLSVRS